MSWKNKPSDFATTFLKDADQHVKKIVGEVLQQVVIRSPVMDGEFRASHKVTLDSPDTSYKKEYDETGSETLAQGLKIAASAQFGGLVYIQTNSPYGPKLENGHSLQAPNGVYALSFQYVCEKYK
ncbi:hypothetical protein [Acinetobacter sp. WCHAc060007]|uniref:hypothetical protein n=1 Tax=Acinetobacter sp. WCHAc060007 TaxID=2419605 RepID=UPI000EA21F26|nr:hypothetical protein [Acinetobacter sp. WCHAc060007]RKG37881.1 hypothetical protein D7V31_16020 [Acinetobacter sp. WCHAc060007]